MLAKPSWSASNRLSQQTFVQSPSLKAQRLHNNNYSKERHRYEQSGEWWIGLRCHVSISAAGSLICDAGSRPPAPTSATVAIVAVTNDTTVTITHLSYFIAPSSYRNQLLFRHVNLCHIDWLPGKTCNLMSGLN